MQPSFEVVSIRSTPSSTRPTGKKAESDAGRLRYSYIPMLQLIANAYQVETYQVFGPSWLATERYEIEAKLPQNSTRDQVPLMLKTMLADRFHFASHRETRQIPVFALVVAKGGPKMRPSQVPDSGVGLRYYSPTKRAIKGKIDIAELVFLLKVPGGDSALAERPLLDMTGLKGPFDIQLEWTIDNPAASGSSDADAGPTIFSALQDQLGLKLEPRRSPAEAIVVDRVDKTPTEN
jgi:uncharacterized protein (TIGR03435 family)